MVANTNLYAKTQTDWIDTTHDELLCFFAITFLMGMNKRPSVEDYTGTPIPWWCGPSSPD
jgi:hypothetical protein